jgi:hypothetical protein
MVRWIGTFVLFVVTLGAADATTILKMERVCPVGGEKYDSFMIGSTSYFGLRLDLRRNGVGAFLPYVECPNGFIVFKDEKDFTPDEIAKLTPVVASGTYREARQSEVDAYRVVLLRRALGASDADLRHQLMQAAFEAEVHQKDALHAKYLALAAAAYTDFVKAHSEQDTEWWVAKLRLAEIARQQGRFADAIAAIDALKGAADPKPAVFRDVAAQIRARAEAGDKVPADFKPADGK